MQVRLVDAFAQLRALLVRADIFSKVKELVLAFFAPVNPVSGILHLVDCVANFVGKFVAPGFQQLAVPVKHRDARIVGAGCDIHPVFGVHHHAAAETVFHAGGKFTPAFDHFVGIGAGAANLDGLRTTS